MLFLYIFSINAEEMSTNRFQLLFWFALFAVLTSIIHLAQRVELLIDRYQTMKKYYEQEYSEIYIARLESMCLW